VRVGVLDRIGWIMSCAGTGGDDRVFDLEVGLSLLRTFAPHSIRLIIGLSKANRPYMLSASIDLGPVESEGSW
jgi:hypothetical protein